MGHVQAPAVSDVGAIVVDAVAVAVVLLLLVVVVVIVELLLCCLAGVDVGVLATKHALTPYPALLSSPLTFWRSVSPANDGQKTNGSQKALRDNTTQIPQGVRQSDVSGSCPSSLAKGER